ncbi:unnamed protein product [Brassica rapa subsp. trilocularis]
MRISLLQGGVTECIKSCCGYGRRETSGAVGISSR